MSRENMNNVTELCAGAIEPPENVNGSKSGGCENRTPAVSMPILEVKNLRKVFKRKGLSDVVAVEDVSLSLFAGECVGLVGESGSGKSSVAHMISLLSQPTSGAIYLKGRDVAALQGKGIARTAARIPGKKSHSAYRSVQMIFQNPVGSFDPRHTLGQSIMEGMRNAGVGKREARFRAIALLDQCGLSEETLNRFPREVSGGQCQRAAIARALALEPKLLICDEATSALDVTVQRQIVDLLAQLRDELDMAILFICHDLALVDGVCDRVLVMKDGVIIEQGKTKEVLHSPQTEYVKRLLSAVL